MQAELDAQKEHLVKLQQEHDALNVEKFNLINENKGSLVAYEKLQNEFNELKISHVDSTATAQTQLSDELAAVNEKLRALEESYENEVKSKNETIEDYEARLEAKSSEIDEFKLQYEDEFERIETINRALLDELETVKLAYEELKNKANSKSNSSRSQNTTLNNNEDDEASFKVLSQSKLKATKVRLFCDICEEFDMHDTEDCPQQSMPQETQIEQQTHSKYNAVKTAPRAYCDHCEQFGHDEDDCPNRIEEF